MNQEAAVIAYRLCESAQRHSRSAAPDEAFLRTTHVDALFYLLTALPRELTPTEVNRLRSATPQAIIEGRGTASSPPTALRRITAWWTALILGWIFILVPLIVTVLNWALRYERQHHLTERGMSYIQQTYAVIFEWLSGHQADGVSRGSLLGRVVVSLLLCLSSLFGEVMNGVEEGLTKVAADHGEQQVLR